MTKARLPVRGDLYYDTETHVWCELLRPEAEPLGSTTRGHPTPRSVRVGLDPLGAETSGDIVAVSFHPDGTWVRRGEAFGSLEAAKFVGPLVAPVSGVIRAHNTDVLVRPGDVNRDPFGAWLVELELVDVDQLDGLLTGEAEVAAWFARERERYQQKGMLAP